MAPLHLESVLREELASGPKARSKAARAKDKKLGFNVPGTVEGETIGNAANPILIGGMIDRISVRLDSILYLSKVFFKLFMKAKSDDGGGIAA